MTSLARLLPVLLLLALTACTGRTAERKLARGSNFVSDPDHLYFKNVRARHYRAQEITNRATLYRHDDLFASAATLRPVLVDNWLQDRAIIRFEVPTEFPGWEVEAKTDTAWVAVPLTVPPSNEELTALNAILLGNQPLRLITRRDTFDAFPDGAGRAEARVTLVDYLALVGSE